MRKSRSVRSFLAEDSRTECVRVRKMSGDRRFRCSCKGNIYRTFRKRAKLYELKKRLIAGLQDVDGVTINALIDPIEETAPHIVSVSFANTRSEVMLHALAQKGVFVSSGSACSSNHPELSGTLQAIGVKSELLDSTLRFSFSVMTTSEEIDYAIEVVKEALPVLRKFTRH